MSSLASQSPTCPDVGRFGRDEIAFALAWEIHAPGLTGWTVLIDTDDDGAELILVDPPLAFDRGFTIQRDGADTVVTWQGGSRRTGSLRKAMLLICPLAPEALEAVDALSREPTLA